MNNKQRIVKYVCEENHYFKFVDPDSHLNVLFIRPQEIFKDLRGKLEVNSLYVIEYMTNRHSGLWYVISKKEWEHGLS